MAVDAEHAHFEEEEEEEYHNGSSHHPSAPSDALFDISTTVDPSYIISLIRKLLPVTVKSPNQTEDAPAPESNFISFSEIEASISKDNGLHRFENASERMGIADDIHNSSFGKKEGEDLCNVVDHPNNDLVGEEAWEEYGCILWDLAASTTHAELMVQNLLLEVLKANLMVSQSVRSTEIILGIIGNLACHETPMKHIVSTNGLIELIVDQLILDDAQCLCEVCRVLTLGLQSSECSTWAAVLQSEHILCHLLWIAENSLNLQLIEKTLELLLAMIESMQEVVHILLPPLMKMGLPTLLVNLLTSEISTLLSERKPERFSILDLILRSVEALSAIDGYSEEISSNKELFRLVCTLIKLPDKIEVGNSSVTSAVLIANILSDYPDLASEIGNDFTFLRGLLDIFPFASDDLEARSALWNIMERLLLQVQECEMPPSVLHGCVSVLAEKSDLIEDDLLDHKLEGLKATSRHRALKRIISILHQWIALKDFPDKNDMTDSDNMNDVDTSKLLDCCKRHMEREGHQG